MIERAKITWLFQMNEQKVSALLTLFDRNKSLESREFFVTLFGMAKYKNIAVERSTSIRTVEE
jgi:hypothetical protein